MSIIQHTQDRKYTKVKGTAYTLPHDEEERRRLTLQSNLFLRTFDNKVIHAPITLADNDWILDAGSGTGIWLQDLAQQTIPKAFYIGVDMESALFPNPNSLPPNMKFETHSVTSLPEEWTNKFTFVHQRLLIAGLRRHEWEQAIDEFYRVLKPGGWIQLFEMETWTSGPSLAKELELMCRHSDAKGTMWRDLPQHLPEFLRLSGFINVHEDVRRTPMGKWAGQDGIDGSANFLALIEGFKIPVLKGGGYGVVKSEVEYDQLAKQVLEELDNTPGSCMSWSMFWAQKPAKTTIIPSRS